MPVKGAAVVESYWDWQLLVAGNSNELRRLAEGRQSHYLVFSGGVDDWLDCLNDDFRIASIYLADADDAYAVSQVGYELLSLFNGASSLFDKGRRKLELVGLARKEGHEVLHPRSAASGLLQRPAIDDSKFQEFLTLARKHDGRVFLLMLATENEDVYQILKYFDMPLDWVTFYKILETLESHGKREGVDLGLDDSQRKAFTNTANNYSLSGLNSRHGFKESLKANKTASMTLSEAYGFVAGAARRYLHAKYGSRHSAKGDRDI